MLEKEMANMFMNTLPRPYLERLVGCNASNFADVVSTGERVENYLRTYKTQSGGGSSSGVKKPFIRDRRGEKGMQMPYLLIRTGITGGIIFRTIISNRMLRL